MYCMDDDRLLSSSMSDDAAVRSIVAQALADISVGIELTSPSPSSNPWRVRAYAGAAEAVRRGAVSLDDPSATPGIGASIASIIRRIVEAAEDEDEEKGSTEDRHRRRRTNSGRKKERARFFVDKVEAAQAEARRAVAEHADTRLLEAYREFRSVLGIGDKKARDLVLRGGLRSVRDLRTREAQEAHGVATPLMRIGLRYHAELQQRVPLGDALDLVRRLKRALPVAERRLSAAAASCAPPHHHYHRRRRHLHLLPLGSVRRQKDTVGDVDLLLWEDQEREQEKEDAEEQERQDNYNNRVMAALKDAVADVLGVDYIATLKCGARRLSFVARISDNPSRACRVDVFRARDATEHATFALYGTGDAEFNEAMRLHAKRRGYRLNEYGLFASNAGHGGGVGHRVPLRSERDIFDALGMRYVPPRLRTGKRAVARSVSAAVCAVPCRRCQGCRQDHRHRPLAHLAEIDRTAGMRAGSRDAQATQAAHVRSPADAAAPSTLR